MEDRMPFDERTSSIVLCSWPAAINVPAHAMHG